MWYFKTYSIKFDDNKIRNAKDFVAKQKAKSANQTFKGEKK